MEGAAVVHILSENGQCPALWRGGLRNCSVGFLLGCYSEKWNLPRKTASPEGLD